MVAVKEVAWVLTASEEEEEEEEEETLLAIRSSQTAKREICWRIPTEASPRSKRARRHCSTTVRRCNRFTKRRSAGKGNKIYPRLDRI